MLKLKLQYLATWCKEPTHWKRPWGWERLKAKEESGRGWSGWMGSPTQWTCTWANFGRQWRTGRPGMLQYVGLQRVRHDLLTEQQQPSHQKILSSPSPVKNKYSKCTSFACFLSSYRYNSELYILLSLAYFTQY